MFEVLQLDINSLKSGLLHLAIELYCKKGRSAKVKDGIRNKCLRNYLVDRCKARVFATVTNFHPSLIFSGEAKSPPLEWSLLTKKDHSLRIVYT
jgi:hypothetical protein